MNHYAYSDDEFDVTDMICPGCRVLNPEMAWVDFGIGPYEYWGAPGCDVQECYVTKCCEADPVEFRPEPDTDEESEETA